MSCSNCGKVAGEIISGAVHGAIAISKNALGIGLAPSRVIAARREKCKLCELNAMGVCIECLCIISQKTSRAEESCPKVPPEWVPIMTNKN